MIIVKTAQEIDIMRESGQVLNLVLAETAKQAVPGITTKELDSFAENLIRKHKMKPGFKGYNGFPATLCTSVNEQIVHGIPGDYKLKTGDIIGIDCGVKHQGLYTDSALTVLVGEVDPNVQFFVKTVKKALNKCIKVVKPGNRIGDISNVIQKTIEQSGFSAVRDCVGHGVGRNLHEDPEICNFGRKGTGEKLEPGMTLAIEPIANRGSFQTRTLKDRWTVVSVDGSLSAHFEHTVAVTENGFEVLT